VNELALRSEDFNGVEIGFGAVVKLLGRAGLRKVPVDLGVVVAVQPLRGETKGLWIPERASTRRRLGAGDGSVILVQDVLMRCNVDND
jgi:hypothetical protein